MPIFDLYSKRQKELRGDIPDVYVYEAVPNPLRVQIVHIWNDVLGNEYDYRHHREIEPTYKFIIDTLCREYGLFKLPTADSYERHYQNELANYLLKESDIDRVMDVIELSFVAINCFTRDYSYLQRNNSDDLANDAISELNSRFKEHGVGFQFIESRIVRIDSELIHSEAVKPALRLLNQPYYQGVQEEFLSVYKHYRHKNNKEALNECLKAFESTMKAICEKQSWDYPNNATAKSLVNVCLEKELIPPFWQTQFSSLRSMLESSIPTGRNKLSGHGQGTQPIEVPDYLVAYMLHMTASALVFLTEAERNLA